MASNNSKKTLNSSYTPVSWSRWKLTFHRDGTGRQKLHRNVFPTTENHPSGTEFPPSYPGGLNYHRYGARPPKRPPACGPWDRGVFMNKQMILHISYKKNNVWRKTEFLSEMFRKYKFQRRDEYDFCDWKFLSKIFSTVLWYLGHFWELSSTIVWSPHKMFFF